MPHGVLKQRVDGQAEPLPVGLHRDLVQLAKLPAAIGGGPPSAQDLHGEAVQGDRLRMQELGPLGGRDDQQPFWLEMLLARSRYIPALSFVEQPPTYADTYLVQRFQASLSAFSAIWSYLAVMAMLFWLLFYAL